MAKRFILCSAIIALLCSLTSHDAVSEIIQTVEYSIYVTNKSETDGNPQTCDTPYSVDFYTDRLFQIRYFVGTSPGEAHSSSIRLHIYVDDGFRHITDWLGWLYGPPSMSLNTGVLDLGLLPSGFHTLDLIAEGQIGGSNTGRLVTWTGRLDLTTSLGDPIPEPSTIMLLATGLAGTFAYSFRRKRKH